MIQDVEDIGLHRDCMLIRQCIEKGTCSWPDDTCARRIKVLPNAAWLSVTSSATGGRQSQNHGNSTSIDFPKTSPTIYLIHRFTTIHCSPPHSQCPHSPPYLPSVFGTHIRVNDLRSNQQCFIRYHETITREYVCDSKETRGRESCSGSR